MPELCLTHGRVELDQHVTAFDSLAVMDLDRAHDSGLERLDSLGTAARDDLPGDCDDIDCAEARPR